VATVPVGKGPFAAALSNDGALLYVSNTDSNNISVIDTKKRVVTTTLTISGKGPSGVVLNANGTRVYVANEESHNISVVDLTRKTEIATIAVGTNPFFIALSPDGRKAYVTNSGSDSMSVVDTVALAVSKTVPVKWFPMGVLVAKDGAHIFVANTSTNTISIIDANTNVVLKTLVVGSTAISGPQQFAPDPSSTQVYVTLYGESSLVAFDSSTYALQSPIPVAGNPMGIAMTTDGKTICVTNQDSNAASFINVTTKKIEATVPVGTKPSFVVISN
jgi:YVTN family beta-propeller protein